MHSASFLNRALHCNHRPGHLKTEHTESLFLLRHHLGNWPRSPAVSMSERTAGTAWETWTVAAAGGVGFARVRWEINFLLTFETAPFICKHPVYCEKTVIYGIFSPLHFQIDGANTIDSAPKSTKVYPYLRRNVTNLPLCTIWSHKVEWRYSASQS